MGRLPAEPETAAALRARLKALLASWEYAFAMGATRTIGSDPRLQPVLDEVADLRRRLAEVERGGG